MEKLIEIDKNTWAADTKFTFNRHKQKSVIVDGEEYIKQWKEEIIFESLPELKKYLQTGKSEYHWIKRDVDFSCFGQPKIYFWDMTDITCYDWQYSYLYYSIVKLRTQYVNEWSLANQLYNYIFYDYSKIYTKVIKYKTIPDKIINYYLPSKKSIFNKKIIRRLEILRHNESHGKEYRQEAFFERNCFYFETNYGVCIEVSIHAVLNCNFANLDLIYKGQIKKYFIEKEKNDFDVRWGIDNVIFKLPKSILQKERLTDSEKTKILSEILIQKANYKERKSYEKQQQRKREEKLYAC